MDHILRGTGRSNPPSCGGSRKASLISQEDILKQRVIQKQLRGFFQPLKTRRASLKAHEMMGGIVEWERHRKVRKAWIIHPDGRIRKYWETFIILVIVVNLIVVPINVAFMQGFEPLGFLIYNVLCDAFFIVDIVLNFKTGYPDKDNTVQLVTMDPGKIRANYLRNWFVMDFISTFPLDYILIPFVRPVSLDDYLETTRLIHMAKFLALLRLLRVFRLVRYMSRFQESFYTSSQWIYVRIANLGLLMILLAHWNACLQFLVNSCLGFPPRCWISLSAIQHAPWYVQWSWGMFSSVSQMFSISYGRWTPETLVDMWFTLLGMLTGASGYALILANTATMWQHADISRKIHRQKMREVEDYMSFRRFPRDMRVRVRDYFEKRYRGHVFNEDDILESMSEPLREVVMRHNCESTIRMVPFFANAEPSFINELVTRLRFDFYQPEDVIVSAGTIGTKMFFLQTGKVNVLNESLELITSLEDGSYFGELCLLIKCKRNATVTAKTHCSLFTLTFDDFHMVLNRFPLIKFAIDSLTNDILDGKERTMSVIADNNDTVSSWADFIGSSLPQSEIRYSVPPKDTD